MPQIHIYISSLKKWLLSFCLFLIGILNPISIFAQSKAALKAEKRYEVNAKRMGVDAASEDALPRSREFKRIDSSYYVGWFFEGMYKLNHAADYLGYKNAIAPLEKALYLLERDYAKELSTHTNDIQIYYPVYNFQLDYTRIGGALRECYANTEQPEKVVTLMRRAIRWKLQRELYLDAYNYLAWTTHRYRFKTKKDYSFLGNNLVENEALAMHYLDTALKNIQKNKRYNDGLFQPGYETSDRLGVYHYKCILYSYDLAIDSAEKYYGIMRKNNVLPHNNYANFKSVIGQFREAEQEYSIASTQESGDKRLQEWAYYTSILKIGKGNTKESIQLADDMIKGFGSSPGFGWYNIGLARALTYDGQVVAAKKAIQKASDFNEVHIGTTLGQSHYDFSVQLLKLIQKGQEIEMQKFENKQWWFSPHSLSNIGRLSAERVLQQYLIVNQFAQNPERDRVVYKLFSTESTVSWDEVWFLIKDYSTTFFIKKFERELKENKRKPINKYFKLFLARLKTKQGNTKEAKTLLLQIITDPSLDIEYEKLFLARSYQALAECAVEEKNELEAAKWTYEMFKTYPQLLPFSNLRLGVKLITTGNDAIAINSFKNSNFDFNPSNKESISVYCSFQNIDGKTFVLFRVLDKDKKVLIKEQKLNYTSSKDAGIQLAYRICSIGGNKD